MNKMAKYKPCGAVDTTISGKLLYLILTDICNKNSEITIPQRRIGEALKISKSTVSKNLHRLEDGGYIDIVTQYNNYGGRAPNKYIIR